MFCMLLLFINISLAHVVDTINIEFAKTAEEESLLWKNEVAKVLQKFPQSAQTTTNSTNALWIHSATPNAPLFIISSGIHGAEAFTGTALQRLFLKKILSKPEIKTNILFVHTINAYGFQNFRRTNLQNIDLNRNFYSSSKGIPTNFSYQKMKSLLEPTHPASASTFSQWIFFLRVGWHYLWHGKKEILGVLTGQTESPKGIYYAGTEPQPETLLVQSWILNYAKDKPIILHIDLHTGFGRRGQLHFFGSDEFQSPEQKQLLQQFFPHASIETGKDKDFYTTHGDLVDWTWQNLPNQKVIPMVFEFGTLDSHTILGGMKSLWISVIENQGHHYGYATTEDQSKIQKLFGELFNPQDETWQKTVLDQGLRELEKSLQALER